MSKDLLTITLFKDSWDRKKIQNNFDIDTHQNVLSMTWNIPWATNKWMDQINDIYELLCYWIIPKLKKFKHVDTIFVSHSISSLFTFDKIVEIWQLIMSQIWEKYGNINTLDLYIEIKDLHALKTEIISNKDMVKSIEEYDIKFINLAWKNRSIIVDNWRVIDSSDL